MNFLSTVSLFRIDYGHSNQAVDACEYDDDKVGPVPFEPEFPQVHDHDGNKEWKGNTC